MTQRGRKALLAFGLLILFLFGSLAWLLGTESGARAALSLARGVSGGALQAEGVEGRLAGPLRIARMAVNTPDRNIILSEVLLDWRPRELASNTLHVTVLRARHLAVEALEKNTKEPPALPKRIGLPFSLSADDVQVDGGEIQRGPSTLMTFGPARLGLGFDGDRYRLELRQFSVTSGSEQDKLTARIHGDANLSAARPYALDGRFSLDSGARSGKRSVDARGTLKLGGSLEEVLAEIGVDANQARLSGKASLRPFGEQLLGGSELMLRGLDLSRFDPGLPRSAFDADIVMTEDGAGIVRVKNADAGTIDEKKLPLDSLSLAFREQPGKWHVDRVDARLGTAKQPAGAMQGSGSLVDGAFAFSLHTDTLDLKRLDRRARATRLKGDVDFRHAQGRQTFSLSFTEPLESERLAVEARGSLADNALTFERLTLQAGTGRLEASGHAALAGAQRFAAKADVTRFRLQDLGAFPQLPALELNGKLDLRGVRKPQLEADLSFSIRDSSLAGQPLAGEGEARLRGETLLVPRMFLASGANKLDVSGQLSGDDAQLVFLLDLRQLRQLGPAFGGALQANGTVRGSLMQPHVIAEWSAQHARLPGMLQVDKLRGKADVVLDRKRELILDTVVADLHASGLRHGENRLASLSAQLRFAPQPDAPLSLSIRADAIRTGMLLAERMTASASGTTARHVIDAALAETGQGWNMKASGGLHDMGSAPQWKGSIDTFVANGGFSARLAGPAPTIVSAQRVQVERFHLESELGRIAVDHFGRDETGVATRGRIGQLQLARVLQQLAPKAQVRTDLRLGGEWDVRIGDALSGTLAMRRESGDLTVTGATPFQLGLRTLAASATITNGRLAAQVQADGQRLGRIDVNAATVVGDGDRKLAIAPEAPVTGNARIDIPSLAWLGPMLSPSIALDGAVATDISVGGTFGEPRLGGSIAGNNLRLVMSGIGLDLRQGVLASTFEGSRMQVHSLAFQGAEGRVSLSGPIDFGGGRIAAGLALRAERFALLNRTDRRILISGESRLDWQERSGKLSGGLTVDSGFIDLGRADKPQLSDDVVIVGQEKKGAAKTALALDLLLALGDGVKVTGRGLDALLGGEIRIMNDAGETMQAQGSFHVIKGTYTAYGRELAIEQGGLRFRGPIANPSLDILAMRRGQEVEAGVSVRGNVLSPRVTLVSEPVVPDAEKLSWLVLGRGLASASGASDAGALQAAAAALLSEGAKAGVQSRIASAFGLDTFNVGTSQDSLQQRIVTLGKQISSRLYVSYQQGLETAGSVVQFRYALSPKLSVEAEAGTRSAISLFYNIAFD